SSLKNPSADLSLHSASPRHCRTHQPDTHRAKEPPMSANPLNSRRNRWIIGGAAGLLVVGGSAALATTAFAGDGANPKTTQVAAGDDYSPTSEPAISLGEAATTAADEVSKGILTSIELEGNKDRPLWKVDLITADGTE